MRAMAVEGASERKKRQARGEERTQDEELLVAELVEPSAGERVQLARRLHAKQSDGDGNGNGEGMKAKAKAKATPERALLSYW